MPGGGKIGVSAEGYFMEKSHHRVGQILLMAQLCNLPLKLIFCIVQYVIVEFQILDFDGLEISAAVETLK